MDICAKKDLLTEASTDRQIKSLKYKYMINLIFSKKINIFLDNQV